MRSRIAAVLVVIAGCRGGAGEREPETVVLPPPKDPPPTVTLADAGGPVEADHCAAAGENGAVAESPTSVWVTRSFLEQAFANGNVASSARIVPSLAGDGGITGLRLYGVRAGGTLDKLGFLNGDELHTVNGRSLTGVDSALEAYNAIRDAHTIAIGLVRNGAAVEHVIHICE